MRLDTCSLNVAALVEPAQLPEPEVDHRRRSRDDEQVERDPPRPEEEPVPGSHGGEDGIRRPAGTVGRVAASCPTSTSRTPRRSSGWWRPTGSPSSRSSRRRRAIRRARRTPTRSGSRPTSGSPRWRCSGSRRWRRAACSASSPTRASAAPRSRSTSSSSACSTTTCAAGSARSTSAEWGGWFATAAAWYRGEPFDVVQLIYPDRNGFLPYEAGFEQRMRLAQPVIGAIRVRGTDHGPLRTRFLPAFRAARSTGPATWVNAPRCLRRAGGMWPERSGNPGVGAARDASS